jgi:hypothetical protein
LTVNQLDLNMAVGGLTVFLPKDIGFNGKINGAIGEILVIVPQGSALIINSHSGIAPVQIPLDYKREGNRILSPLASGSANSAHLDISQAIGVVRIRYAP